MKLGGLGAAGRDLRALLEGRSLVSLSDGELLDRFARGRGDSLAESAFSALVARHGPMVWGTCRRILRDPHAAEDAFQATFLILVKKAGSVKVEDSLGRWLHGVGVRVALRARADRARSGRDLAGIDPAISPIVPDDLKAVIDEEVERLPKRYRLVVVLCHLEGLTRESAATRLRCPVGTVNSRLSRASEILRTRLTRRGLAPASGGFALWLSGTEVSASVPIRLIGTTVAASMAQASGLSLAGVVPVGVAFLLQQTLRRMGMMTLMKTLAIGSMVVGLTAFGLVSTGQEPAKQVPANGKDAAGAKPPAVVEPAKKPSLAEAAAAVKAEWEAGVKVWQEAYAKAKTKAEQDATYEKFYPNEVIYFAKALDLGDVDPRNVGARDAWLWVVEEGMRNDDSLGARSALIRKAVEGLLGYHFDDPLVARTVLKIDNGPSRNRSMLTRGLYDKAVNHEAKGLATLALAQYLTVEALDVEQAHDNPIQPNIKFLVPDEQGRMKTQDCPPRYSEVDWERLKSMDHKAMRRESEQLYQRVIAEFADVPFNPVHYEKDKLVKNPHPMSLADHAKGKIDLVAGKPCPEIEGVDLDGKPLKLSDFKGKLVAVVFWHSTWPGEVAQQKALVERLKGKPFILLGVNTDENPEAARKAAKDYGMTWPSWRDGTEGPIVERLHVESLSITLLVDAQGKILIKDRILLDECVEDLLREMEAKPADPK
jgi:RNA polymerase sigma factor (sigma-70 family)